MLAKPWIIEFGALSSQQTDPNTMHKLVLIRHGESTWNQENRFTGWTDVGLTEKGQAEAVAAGQLLKQEGYAFDIAYTSVLRRAIKTRAGVAEMLMMSRASDGFIPKDEQ